MVRLGPLQRKLTNIYIFYNIQIYIYIYIYGMLGLSQMYVLWGKGKKTEICSII